MRRFVCLLLFALHALVSFAQTEKQDAPLKVTMCDLYEHPEQYAGKMVEVRANASRIDFSLGDFSNRVSCSAYMNIHLEFPHSVKPAPGFDTVQDEAFNEFVEKRRQKGMNVMATYEGRFDPLFVWRDQKRIRVGQGTDKGYGKKHQYDGRILLRKISDVLARPIPGR